ncbi:nucleolar protein 58-like [Macrobrachium rosenbergii]|uniref:nucleolar protein 58-like n=1 Tax=Macrobrachium rosenbergii TaxID=79674 RepID=UPI0034D5079D
MKSRNSKTKKERRGKDSEKPSRGEKKPKEKRQEDRKKPSRGEKKPKEKREDRKKLREKRGEGSMKCPKTKRWTEDEPEQWLEEIEFLFETYDVGPAERASVLTKHLEGKAKAAHRALERYQ